MSVVLEEQKYLPWDEQMTWNGRYWHCCPICKTGMVTSPFDADAPFAHSWCLEAHPEKKYAEDVK